MVCCRSTRLCTTLERTLIIAKNCKIIKQEKFEAPPNDDSIHIAKNPGVATPILDATGLGIMRQIEIDTAKKVKIVY